MTKSPAEMRAYLIDQKYEWRIRFAFLPVQLYEINPQHHWVERVGRVWLCNVVEIKTFFDGWYAYKEHQIAAHEE